MKVARIVCHLGLGDLILHSAVAVHLLLDKSYDLVYYPSRTVNLNSVRSFFLLTPQIQVYVVNAATTTPRYQDYHPDPTREDIYISGFNGPPMDGSVSFAEAAYRQLGIDYSVRFDYCPVRRVVEQFYSTPGGTLVDQFVHDDPERQINIKEEHLEPDGRICFARYSESSILAYAPIIRRAQKIEVIDGPFQHLIDSLPGVEGRMRYHKYARMGRMWNNIDVPSRYKQWEVIE